MLKMPLNCTLNKFTIFFLITSKTIQFLTFEAFRPELQLKIQAGARSRFLTIFQFCNEIKQNSLPSENCIHTTLETSP
jgi:hypothetical protein